LNRIYRLVWSESNLAFVPASEITRRRCKRSGSSRALAGALVAGAVSLSAQGANAGPQAGSAIHAAPTAVQSPVSTAVQSAVSPGTLPTSPKVTAGQASVAVSGDEITVTETSSAAAIDWNTFSIGSAAGVTFVQPSASSVVLNRVLSANPSQIYGSLDSNGLVFLINPQGVLIGQGAEVNVGGLVASTLDLSNKNLLAGNWSFSAASTTGTVSNAGAIHVAPGGFAALLGTQVDNTGSISAKLGSVALASGNQVTLDFDDSGLLKVAVNQAALDAMVQNSGAIVADGGRVILTAKSANDVLGAVVNNSGLVQAQSIGERGGQVWLLASDELANTGVNGAAANAGAVQGAAGGVVDSGTIDVSAQGAAAAGQATLAGTTVTVSGAIDAGDASANGAAGRVLLNSTQATTLAASSLIDVSSAGAGGKLIAWSDGDTTALGAVDGRGMGASGAGATVEMSSAHGLGFDADVKLGATTSANAGTLILDPATLEIAPGSGSATDTVYQSALQTQSGNVVLSATGQITVDAMTNNVLNFLNASSLSITSQNTGGIVFLNGAGGAPSGITTHNAPVTLTAAGSGSLSNIGTITTHGGDITLSGVYVHLAGGLDAMNGINPAGTVSLSVFGGGILSSSASPIAGSEVTLDATYGYIGTAAAPVPTATWDLVLKTGGNAFVANTGLLDTFALTSNHLEGTPVAIDVTASNLNLIGADGTGDGSMYSNAVRFTEYSATNPSGVISSPGTLTITEDGNLAAGNIDLPQTALTLTSSQGYILGGNSQPVIASSLNLASPLGIGGTDFNGINAENDQGYGGNTLLIQAGTTVTANVLNPSGSITGIVNLTQQGDLVGSVEATQALLQASGNIGSVAQPFALNTSWYGDAHNVVAGGNINLDAQFLGTLSFDNIQAGGSAAVQASTQNGWNLSFGQATAGGDLNLTGVQVGEMQVDGATSTNGSITLTNDYNLDVYNANLNGTDAVGRSINLTSNDSNVGFGPLSTNGPAYSSAASAPVGSINIAAPQGGIYTDGEGVLRAGNASLSALYWINFSSQVDTYTNLTLTSGTPGSGSGDINANLSGIDSVNDPNGSNPHSIHIASANSYDGNLNINNYNGDLDIGSLRSYYDCGDGCYGSGNINLYANGSIVADGSVGGGRINAADPTGNGGYISLNAVGNLGLRGTGADGTTGAVYLSLSGNSFDLYTGGDLFVNNDQSSTNNLNLHLTYASSNTPYFYHFTSADASEALAGTPAVTFNAGSSAGLLTVNSATIDDSGSGVRLNTDGDIRVVSWQAGQSSSLGIYGQNISIDAPVGNTPALSMGDSSWLQIQAQGSLTVGHMASTGSSPGDSSVDLEAYGGNLTLGVVSAANANVTVYASQGDILGSAGNQVLANNLTLNNSFGAIGADPTVIGSVPITIGVAQNLTITNEGGGGSINLVTLNDPTSLNLTLYTPSSSSYAGANFLMTPATTGLGFSGSADSSGVTLATLGTTGASATAVPVTITTDTPSITINSGAGSQLGIGYNLYFGNSYQSMAANLAGSAGQDVIVHLDDNVSSMNSLTGNIALTNLQIDENFYSWHSPLTVDLTLTRALNAFTLVRTGDDYDPTSFNGSSLELSGSGQTFSAVETAGVPGSTPGVTTVNAASATALDLTVNLQTAGIIDVGTINFGSLGTVNLSAGLNYQYASPFSGVTSAIEGVDGSNLISAANVNLGASTYYAGQATLGTSSTAMNVDAPNVALTSSGDIYLTTGGTLSSLAITVSHPHQDTSGNFHTTTENYVYQIGGSTTLTATDDAADTATALNFTSSSPVSFSFTTDRTIDVGTINAGVAGSVTLNANGNWTNWPYHNYTHIGIEQGSGSGITAGTVNLNATGYQGHAGTDATALEVDTAHLSVNVDAEINIADSAVLNSLNITLAHNYDDQTGWRDNDYAITAPNIALTLVDQQWNGYGVVALENLVSASLQTFSLSLLDSTLAVGTYGGDFSGGQISLGSGATANLSASGSIWAQTGGGSYTLSDTASSAVANSAVAIKVGTLNLNAGSSIVFGTYGCGAVVCDTLPVEVDNLSINAAGAAYVTNVGNLNVVSTSIGGSGYLRAVEAAPSTSASITGGSIATPLGAGDLTLVTFYGDIGTSAAPVVTNTATLTLESGADIYAANQQQLATLSIDSDHHKASVGDTSNGGLNTLVVTDTSTQGAPLQLGVTDLGAGGGGYQLTGLNAPQLNFSFETDDGISVGALAANSVALISDTASILHIPGNGTITAGSVSFLVPTGQSVGAAGESILIDSPNLTVSTGGNMYVADSADIASLRFNIGSVTDLGTTPVYQLDNSAAPNPLAFNVTADTTHDILDVNSIVVSRTDAPVQITLYSLGSGFGIRQISDGQVAGGEVDVWSDSSHNVFSLGSNPAGISATTVSLIARYGSIGTDFNGNPARMVVTADSVSALSSGDMRLTSTQNIADLTLQLWSGEPVGAVWNVSTPHFALQGTVNNAGTLDIFSVTGATTNLEVDTVTPLSIGTLTLGSGSLDLNAYFNNSGHAIESDGSNGGNANITTTGDVTLNAYSGIGDTAQITTNVSGNVSVSNWVDAIDLAQISATPLVLSALNQCGYCGGSPITVTAVGDMTLTNGLNSGSGSAVSLTAGGDINYLGTLNLNGGAITISAAGSITGNGNIWQASTANLTAAGTAPGSSGGISIGGIDYAYWNPASGDITLNAVGDIDISGQVISRTGVSITSTAGSIYSQGSATFSITPSVTLSAFGDIGEGSSGAVTPWSLNGGYNDNPGSFTLSAHAGGQIDITSYAAVDATLLSGGGNVSLQVMGDAWHVYPVGLTFGHVSSTDGSVYLGTDQGSITADAGASAITAATSITLTASQNKYFDATGALIDQVFNLGSYGTPLSLTAPQINLTANGNIYATVPTTGLTDLSVARTYVSAPGGVNQSDVMPASTVLVKDPNDDTVLDVADGGWASGNVSAISASYGTALNLSYAGNNAIALGTITLNGGDLNLQATSPSNISITSTGGLIEANNFSFNLVDANGIDGTQGTATGGFGTRANPINTQITSLSGVTVGATAGVFMNQSGAITFTNLTTGGDIDVTTTRVSGALTADANIAIGSVTSNGGSVSFTADGAIVAANGVSAPVIAANGPSNDGGVTLTAAAGVNLPNSSISSNNGSVNITAAAGGIAMAGSSVMTYNGGDIDIAATAGGVSMASSTISAYNGNVSVSATDGGIAIASSTVTAAGNITVHAVDDGIDLTASNLQANGGSSLVTLTADQGDVTFGSINSPGAVAITATTGGIYGTPTAQNLSGLDGISVGGDITLNAATGIGTAALPVSVNTWNTITTNTTGDGANIFLVTGIQNSGGQSTIEASSGGAINIANYYSTLTLDTVQAQGDIAVTEQNYYGELLLNDVAATGPGATFTFNAPYGDISSTTTSGSVSASRIVLNALGDSSGGTLGQNYSPVNVDGDVVIAVASGNISLNSVNTGTSKMPLVASNGFAPTVSITSTGDFLVGQVVAGQQGTVNIISAGNIYDDGDDTTQIYAGTVNLSAADAIGTAQTPISMTAISYDGGGNVLPGTISAASTTAGSIYINQTGDAVMQSLTAANGSINVTVNDPAHGQSTLVFADTTATDQAGNDINVTVTNGDLTVDVAQAGMTAGTVNLNTPSGSIYGDGRSDCCTNPNVSGNTVNLTAQNNIGSISDLATLSGTALGVEANQSSATTSADSSQIYIQYVGNATVGSSGANSVAPMGSNAQVLIAACGNLTLAGLSLPGAALGLNAGTGGSGGSILDGIGGGASAANPDVSAASINFGAATNVGDPAASLWVNTPTIVANAANGGVWINDAATTPATVSSVTAGNGPVVIGGTGNLLIGSINAGSDSATVTSSAGAVLDGTDGGANAGAPNITASSVTVDSATNGGAANNALWVNSPTITAAATSGGVWINDASTSTVTVSSVTTGGGAVVIGSQGDLSVQSVNAGSGSATLNSATGAVIDGITGGSNAGNPNVTAGSVSVNSAVAAGNASDALWVNAAAISGSATNGGVWINDAATTPATVSSVTAGAGPVVIGGTGNLLIGSINAGSDSATVTSSAGAVLDGTVGGANAGAPNITAGSVTVDSATNGGASNNALWVNSPTITAAATNGGVWINDAATAPVTVSSVTAGNGAVVIGSQGDLSVVAVNAGSNSATLNSATGAVIDGITGGSNAGNPNVTAGSVSVNSAVAAGNASDALWVNAATISGSSTSGGVWINDAATTPVTVASVTTGGGPVVIGGQANLLIGSIDAGSGSTTLTSNTGAVLDGTVGGSSAGHPNVTSGSVVVNSATDSGSASNALWVDAAAITAAAPGGGVWINDAATSPVTVSSVTAGNGPVVLGSTGNMLVGSINAGSDSATLSSSAGAVLDGVEGHSNAMNPNVTAGSVTVDSATNAGNASNALWVDAATIAAAAPGGGVWINDAATTPVTVTSVTAGGGPVVIATQGNLAIGSINAGTGSATLTSATGSVLDGTSGGSDASHPNVTAGAVTVDSANNSGSASNALWVDAAAIAAAAPGGGVWINDAATTPVAVTSVSAGNGPVVIGSTGNMLVGSIDAGSNTATLSSSAGAVLDGRVGGSSADHPNVTAAAVTVDSATNAGNAGNALWVNAATITAAAPGGGVWINDAATTPVTVPSVTAGGGAVVIGGAGNLLIGSIDAGSNSATLSSSQGEVLDGLAGGSSASHPNVIASAVTVDSATNSGNSSDALWVDAAAIAAAAPGGGVWINDRATTPVTVTTVSAGAGPVVIGGQGTLVLGSIEAGTGDVSLTSITGAILDGISGGSNTTTPNVTGGTVTLDAATTVGSIWDRVYVNAAGSIQSTTPTASQYINAPPTPYPALPLVIGVSPVTEYAAYAQAQVQAPQQLPITLIGQPVRMAPPIEVTADLFGIALPSGVDSTATQQDTTLGTASQPIFGGNDDEILRIKDQKLKRKAPKTSRRNDVKQTKWEG
jgi:filamentous hemagglutinin family protein